MALQSKPHIRISSSDLISQISYERDKESLPSKIAKNKYLNKCLNMEMF